MTRKRKISTVAFAAVVLVAILFHSLLLRGLARPLISEQMIGDYDGICLISSLQSPEGDRCYDVAAQLWRDNPTASVLILEPPDNRIVEAGALPSFATVSRRELSKRGVPEEAVVILPREGIDDWTIARALGDRLSDRPETTVVLLCDEFHSARLRAAVDESVGEKSASQVWIMPLSDRRFNRDDWWKTRTGTRTVGMSWLMLLQHWFSDWGATPPQADADEYEKRVIESWREDAP